VAEFFDNTLITRLDERQRGAIVIIMQRLHEHDLVGHVLERGEWEVVALPAIAPEEAVFQLSENPADVYRRSAGELLDLRRDTREELETIRRAQGSIAFQAQFQQQPVPPGGNLIRREWLRHYDTPPERFDRVIASWDTASTISQTSDWSVCTVWGAVGLDYYLLHVYRARLEPPDLRRAILRIAHDHAADTTLIEDTELGRSIAHDIWRGGTLRPILPRPLFSKEARLLAQSARFEAGQVLVPAQAPWLGDYLHELLAFPNGAHDDQVDSTSQALNWLVDRSPIPRETVRRAITNRRRIRPASTPDFGA
jgi:predicted phage terminase large subunit-like protein